MNASTTAVPRVYLDDAVARGVVVQAIHGAQLRLARPGCLQVLNDFRDQAGDLLQVRLEASGITASDYLVERLWFVDGAAEPQCVKHVETAAFTESGSKVVHLCGARLARLAQGTAVEMLVIHEMLHSLGLGENPPSSQDITRRVTKRCGGS